MTITRADWDEIAAFVASLPKHVPPPEIKGKTAIWWNVAGFTPGDTEEQVADARKYLVAAFRPPPRHYRVLVIDKSLSSLDAGRTCAVWIDAPESREYLTKAGETWRHFDLIENDG